MTDSRRPQTAGSSPLSVLPGEVVHTVGHRTAKASWEAEAGITPGLHTEQPCDQGERPDPLATAGQRHTIEDSHHPDTRRQASEQEPLKGTVRMSSTGRQNEACFHSQTHASCTEESSKGRATVRGKEELHGGEWAGQGSRTHSSTEHRTASGLPQKGISQLITKVQLVVKSFPGEKDI